MENASKALIIAGAILIAILLISVGILILNSISGVTDSAKKAGSEMTEFAELENARIVLATMNIKDDDAFNDYIYNRYGSVQKSSGNNIARSKECNITASEVRELCALVIERNKKLTGGGNDRSETYISSRYYENCKVYYRDGEYHFELDEDALYQVTLEQNYYNNGKRNEGVYSVQIRPIDK